MTCNARCLCGLAVVLLAAVCLSAVGQAPGASPGTVPPTFTPTSSSAPTWSTPPSAPPSLAPSPGWTAPPGTAPPIATFDGTIQTPPPTWDPYATPGTTPPSLFPQDPSVQFPTPTLPSLGGAPVFSITTMRRFLDEVRLDFVWMPGGGVKGFGVTDLGLSATFAIPVLNNIESPILVTPGFAFHWWDGPEPWEADLPPRAYDAFLAFGWNPQVTPWLGGELAVSVGVYSDFDRVTSESLRYPSKGMLVLTFTPSIQIKGGVWYLDRNRVKLLPAGGLIWTPNPDVRFDILFPDPKIARRCPNLGVTEWWIYLRGEYGGGAWTVTRDLVYPAGHPLNPSVDEVFDSVDYNDIRVALGMECARPSGWSGLFEAGIAFQREIRYRNPDAYVFHPDPTVFLRAGLSY